MKHVFLGVVTMLALGILSGIAYYRRAEAAHCAPCCTVDVNKNECCQSSSGACTVYPCILP